MGIYISAGNEHDREPLALDAGRCPLSYPHYVYIILSKSALMHTLLLHARVDVGTHRLPSPTAANIQLHISLPLSRPPRDHTQPTF